MSDIELNEADERIIDVLREGRNTPANIARRLDYTREYVANRIKRLVEHGVLGKPDRGIYELREPPDEPDERQGERVEASASAGLRDVLERAGWNPGHSRDERDERLRAAVKALEYLRDQEQAQKGDFLEALHPDHAPDGQNADTFWKKVVRGSVDENTGALAIARNADLVEREHGPPHIYRWVGNNGQE